MIAALLLALTLGDTVTSRITHPAPPDTVISVFAAFDSLATFVDPTPAGFCVTRWAETGRVIVLIDVVTAVLPTGKDSLCHGLPVIFNGSTCDPDETDRVLVDERPFIIKICGFHALKVYRSPTRQRGAST